MFFNLGHITSKCSIFILLFSLGKYAFAVEPHIIRSCNFSTKEAAKYAQMLNDNYKAIALYKSANRVSELQEFLNLHNGYIERTKNQRFKLFQSILESYNYSSSVQVSAAIDESVFSYAGLLAMTEPSGTKEETFYRKLYEDCVEIGNKSALDFENSPSQIERVKEINRLQQEILKPKPQVQQERKQAAPARPLNCFTQPDGPGSSRMITTCF
jgi:hypothetical protein